VDISIEMPDKPFNGGHLVVKAGEPIFNMQEKELVTLKKILDKLIAVEKQKLKPEGFNIYISNSDVHLVPRWCGDINVAFFGDIKVIPISKEDVEEIIKDVKRYFYELDT